MIRAASLSPAVESSRFIGLSRVCRPMHAPDLSRQRIESVIVRCRASGLRSGPSTRAQETHDCTALSGNQAQGATQLKLEASF